MLYDEFGLTKCDETKATAGYTLFSPLWQSHTYLINMKGEVVHRWDWQGRPNAYGHLLPGGNLLFGEGAYIGEESAVETGLKEVDWDGNLVWSHLDPSQHHDFRRLANGNTLYIGLEELPADAAARVRGGLEETEGRDGGKIESDYFREISPEGETVWEWHTHTDLDIENYPVCPLCSRSDYLHVNAIAETADGGIMISSRHTNLVAVIDKSTNKFSWEHRDLDFGHQHDFHQIENGNYLLFANGAHTTRTGPTGGSKIIEINPATKDYAWVYKGKPEHTFNSRHISGCQRLASGNTLICEGVSGRLFEVTPDNEIVWNYVSPYFAPETIKGRGAGQNMVFRAIRYAADSPELSGLVDEDAFA